MVKRGQTYKVPRIGKPAAYVRIKSVRKGQQPKVTYFRYTKSGKKSRGQPVPKVRWLQWSKSAKAWTLPATWELV
jgi:hypothetical protein